MNVSYLESNKESLINHMKAAGYSVFYIKKCRSMINHIIRQTGVNVWKSYKERSLSFQRPELVAEWDTDSNYPDTPDTVYVKSNKLVLWKCRKGHRWKAMIENRSNGQSCPKCYGNFIYYGHFAKISTCAV